MSATRKMRTKEECGARVFHRRSLRRSFALVLGLGFSATVFQSGSFAQYASGDLPASPWSNRGENIQGRRMENASRPTNARLRQPNSAQKEAVIQLRSADVPASESARPAPVILMGPMAPTIRPQSQPQPINLDRGASFPTDAPQYTSQALNQKKPVATPSDWHRVPSGGLVLEDEEPRFAEAPGQDLPEYTVASAPSVQRRIGAGLPDREDASNSTKLPSQMASTKSSMDREEPIVLKLRSPIIEKEVSEPVLDDGIESPVAPSKPNGTLTTLARSESILQLESPTKTTAPTPPAQQVNIASNANAFPVVSATPPAEASKVAPAVDEYQMKKFALAQRVSHELLSNTPTISARAPEALESLPGWQSIERELKQRLERCDTLLKRGVVLSAREEASQGLLRLYRTMDLQRSSLYSEPAFEKALIAFREEQDFQKNIRSSQGISVQAIVDTHATEALKNRPLESTSPEMAAMHYRWYARYQLLTASDGHPWAADLLYAYGKTLEKEAELNPARTVMLRSQAVICYQAATQITPAQSDASNQLGYALIHLDRMDDAYAALTASIQNKPNANAWNNLAEVFRRQGKAAEAEYAVQQASALENATPQYTPQNPEITEVDPAVFAKYSPVPTMVGTTQNFSANSVQANGSNGNVSNAPAAKSGKSFFSKFFQK